MCRRSGLSIKPTNVYNNVQICIGTLLSIYILSGCNSKNNNADDNCDPVCDSTNQCQDDQCGGICGCVSDDEVCNEDGACVSGDCSDGCGDRECGSVCGTICGDDPKGRCADGERCVSGMCECEAQCDNVQCGQDDGCGNACDCWDGKQCDKATGKCVGGEGVCSDKECGTWDGEYCGSCPDNLLCDADGKCVEDCNDLCSDVGWECDESICHDECGSCGKNEECVNHVCVCRPGCEPGSCSDGCGGTCDCEVGQKCEFENWECVPCTEEDTCGEMECGEVCGHPCGENDGKCGDGESCIQNYCYPSTLKMGLVSSEFSTDDAKVHGVLRIEYVPRPDEPRPRMADLRIWPKREVGFEIESATLGGAAVAAKKALYLDPISLMPWRYRPDGAVQFLIHADNAEIATADKVFEDGILLTVNFIVELKEDDPKTAIEENAVALSLVRRDQTFAPFDADIALQETAYEQAVTVTK